MKRMVYWKNNLKSQFICVCLFPGEVRLFTEKINLGHYVAILLQIRSQMIDLEIDDNGYLMTRSIQDCVKISGINNVVSSNRESTDHYVFTGGLVSRKASGMLSIDG